MCGIFGIAFTDSQRRVDQQMLIEATNLMMHRGPDDGGYWVCKNLGLGHRRLSIIDLSPLGHQPMFNEDGAIALVYNGEIYNFQEIYAELVLKGHRFKSRSDTEVIIHAYEEWGVECLKKFNGMFAFGLWDARNNSLWIVRDRLGVKPLYYFYNNEVLLFSSEIKPLLQTGFVTAEVNVNVLDAYLSVGYVPAPETMFKGIFKLRPGHFMVLKDGYLTEKEYWDFAHVEPTKGSFEESKQRLDSLLTDSISKRLISDVPLGAFLSGGLDSSVVVSLMSSMVNTPINTYTVGYDSAVSEERYAELVATKYSTNHHLFKLDEEDFFSSISTMIDFSEEPVVEPAAIALYHISKLARKTATVLLSGEGSDELFAGYYLYNFMAKLDGVQRFIPPGLLCTLGPFLRKFGKLKHLKYLDWFALPLEKRYQGTSSYLTESVKQKLYSVDFFTNRGSYLNNTFQYHFDRVSHMSDTVNKMLYVDTKTWLVDDLLLKADKMTMAASIELRVPFLDYRFVEFAISLPSSYKIFAGSSKHILKRVIADRLPPEIVNRKKMGFPVPIDEWFGNDLYSVISEKIRNSDLMQLLNNDAIEAVLGRHQSGVEVNGKMIMSLLVLAMWKDKFINKSIKLLVST